MTGIDDLSNRTDEGSDPPGPDAIESRSSIGRNLVHLLASQVTTWVLATILIVLQPRYLGPEQIGQVRLAFSMWAIAQIVIHFGTSEYLKLTIARDRERGLRLTGPVIMVRIVVFGASAIVLGGYVAATGASREFALIMFFYGLFMLLEGVAEALTAAFIGLERMSIPATAMVIARVTGTIAAVIVLLLGGQASSMIAVLAGGQLLSLVLLSRAFRDISQLTFRGWTREARHIAAKSYGYLFAGATLVVYLQVDTIVISLLVDDEVLGWYGTADTLYGSLLFPITIVMSSIFPVIGRLHATDPGALIAMIQRAVATLLVVIVPIGLGTVIIAQPLALLLFGEQFRESGQVLAVLGPVAMLTMATILFGTVAVGTGRERFWNVVMVCAIVLTVPLDFLFVPWADRTFSNGAIGGAMSYVFSEALMVVIGLWKIVPYLLERGLAIRGLKLAVAGTAMFLATWPLRLRFLPIPILVAAAVYVVALLLLRIPDDDERAQFDSVVQRLTGGRVSRLASRSRTGH